MPKLILRKHPSGPGELAYEIHDNEATKMIQDGTAIMLPDGILREVEKAPAKKAAAEYTTKDMAAKKKATKKG